MKPSGSKILGRVDKTTKSQLFTDGAVAWPAAVKKQNLKHIKSLSVVHKRNQFTKKVKGKKKPKFSNTAGTQAVDRWWEALEEYVPSQLRNKTQKGGEINPTLIEYLYSFVWRYKLPPAMDMKTELGKICAM